MTASGTSAARSRNHSFPLADITAQASSAPQSLRSAISSSSPASGYADNSKKLASASSMQQSTNNVTFSGSSTRSASKKSRSQRVESSSGQSVATSASASRQSTQHRRLGDSITGNQRTDRSSTSSSTLHSASQGPESGHRKARSHRSDSTGSHSVVSHSGRSDVTSSDRHSAHLQSPRDDAESQGRGRSAIRSRRDSASSSVHSTSQVRSGVQQRVTPHSGRSDATSSDRHSAHLQPPRDDAERQGRGRSSSADLLVHQISSDGPTVPQLRLLDGVCRDVWRAIKAESPNETIPMLGFQHTSWASLVRKIQASDKGFLEYLGLHKSRLFAQHHCTVPQLSGAADRQPDVVDVVYPRVKHPYLCSSPDLNGFWDDSSYRCFVRKDDQDCARQAGRAGGACQPKGVCGRMPDSSMLGLARGLCVSTLSQRRGRELARGILPEEWPLNLAHNVRPGRGVERILKEYFNDALDNAAPLRHGVPFVARANHDRPRSACGSGFQLMQYQASVHAIMSGLSRPGSTGRGIMVWHSTGAGKTATAVGVMDAFWESHRRIIFLSSKEGINSNGIGNFFKEARRFWPRFKTWPDAHVGRFGVEFRAGAESELMGTGRTADGRTGAPRVVTMTYTTFCNQMGLLSSKSPVRPPEYKGNGQANQNGRPDWARDAVVIIDEVHTLVTKKSSQIEEFQNRAVWDWLTRTDEHVEALKGDIKVVILTATPGDSMQDTVQLLNIVRAPAVSAQPIEVPDMADANSIRRFKRSIRGLISFIDYSRDVTHFPVMLNAYDADRGVLEMASERMHLCPMSAGHAVRYLGEYVKALNALPGGLESLEEFLLSHGQASEDNDDSEDETGNGDPARQSSSSRELTVMVKKLRMACNMDEWRQVTWPGRYASLSPSSSTEDGKAMGRKRRAAAGGKKAVAATGKAEAYTSVVSRLRARAASGDRSSESDDLMRTALNGLYPKMNMFVNNLTHNGYDRDKHYAYTCLFGTKKQFSRGSAEVISTLLAIHPDTRFAEVEHRTVQAWAQHMQALTDEHGAEPPPLEAVQALFHQCFPDEAHHYRRHVVLSPRSLPGAATTGSSGAGKGGQADYIGHFLRLFNHKLNADGRYIRLVLASGDYSASLDLAAVRHTHLLEPMESPTREKQALGRAVRNCSHAQIPYEHWQVMVHRYMTVLPPADDIIAHLQPAAPIRGAAAMGAKKRTSQKPPGPSRATQALMDTLQNDPLASQQRTIDYLVQQTALAIRRNHEIFLTILKSCAVDCALFKDFHGLRHCTFYNADPDHVSRSEVAQYSRPIDYVHDQVVDMTPAMSRTNTTATTVATPSITTPSTIKSTTRGASSSYTTLDSRSRQPVTRHRTSSKASEGKASSGSGSRHRSGHRSSSRRISAALSVGSSVIGRLSIGGSSASAHSSASSSASSSIKPRPAGRHIHGKRKSKASSSRRRSTMSRSPRRRDRIVGFVPNKKPTRPGSKRVPDIRPDASKGPPGGKST